MNVIKSVINHIARWPSAIRARFGPVPRPDADQPADRGDALRMWRDALIPALPLLILSLGSTAHGVQVASASERALDGLAMALVTIAGGSLFLRRVAPLPGLAICGLATAAYLVLGYPFGPMLLDAPVAVYAVAQVLPARQLILAVAIFLTGTVPSPLPRWLSADAAPDSLLSGLWWVGRWSLLITAGAVAGLVISDRRRYRSRARRARAERVASEERLAMARDVHDGVGHGLAVIAMHAGVALHVLDRDPERARELLRTIRATSRQSLEDLRDDLARLRAPDLVAAPRRPGHGVSDLPVLLDRMRSAGLTIDAQLPLDRDEPELPAPVDAAAYRIVQESLTNVLRHTDLAPTTVRISREPQIPGAPAERLVIEVVDAGAPQPVPQSNPTGGSGIIGMRHRAESLGGTLTAGPNPDRGFTVRAELPLAGEPQSPGEVTP